MEELVYSGERIDDLQINDLKIIQNPKCFCFGIDAVLLANFATLKKHSKVVDLGTGTGIIPILVAGKNETCEIVAIEIQEQMAEMASRSVKLNGLQDRIRVLNIDLKEAPEMLEANSYDAITVNPPYMHPEGLINPNDNKAISRHEVMCTLADVMKVASRLLKFRGSLFMVHRPQRLADIICLAREHKLEPKRIQFVQSSYNKKPNLLLIECRKSAQPELLFLDPIVIYDEAGNYTEKVLDIYNKKSLELGGDSAE